MPQLLAAVDPAREIVATILELVPAAHWSFARFHGDGDCDRERWLSSSRDVADFDMLGRQFALEREFGKGPHIGATRGSIWPYTSGLTLLFADSRAEFGILTLLRTPDLGPFAASEVRTLAFALEAATESFSTQRLFETRAAFDTASEPGIARESVLYILDRDLTIVLARGADDPRAQLHDRLPRLLEEAVRGLTTHWSDDIGTHTSGTAQPVPFLRLRTQALRGSAGTFIGVTIERTTPPDSLTHAADFFGISPREVQVLALLLCGAHLNDVASRLFITSSTVQDHIKSLLHKTATHNRSEMIATVLRAR